MYYLDSVPGVVNGTCNIFWKPKVDNKRVCKNDGNWEETTNECIEEEDIFKIDFSQLNIEVVSVNQTMVSGNLLIHDRLECNSPFPPNSIYLMYCYSPFTDKCENDGYGYGNIRNTYSYCFKNNTLSIPISKTYTNTRDIFSNYFVVKIFNDNGLTVLYAVDHRGINILFYFLNSINL